jgi:hypothetical protein
MFSKLKIQRICLFLDYSPFRSWGLGVRWNAVPTE